MACLGIRAGQINNKIEIDSGQGAIWHLLIGDGAVECCSTSIWPQHMFNMFKCSMFNVHYPYWVFAWGEEMAGWIDKGDFG